MGEASAVFKYTLASVTVCLMVTASFITQRLQVEYNYSQPVFIVYFGTSMLVVCIPAQILYYHCWIQPKSQANMDETAYVTDDRNSLVYKWSYLLYVTQVTHLPLKKLALMAIPFTSMWLAANFLLVSSFQFSDVASLLAAEQAAATFFVYSLSVFVLKESLSYGKVGGVLVCIAGVVYLAVGDSKQSDSEGSSLGIFLAIGAAFASALYMVSTKRFLGAMRGIPAVTSLLGSIGLANMVFMWPIVLIADTSGWEDFEFPSGIPCLLLFGSALGAFLFNYCVAWGIAISSPLFMRVATITTIPVSFIIELTILGGELKIYKIVGGLLVVVGFVSFSVFSEISQRKAAHARLRTLSSSSAQEGLVDGDASAAAAAAAVDEGDVTTTIGDDPGALPSGGSGILSNPVTDKTTRASSPGGTPVIPPQKREFDPLVPKSS